MKLDEYQYVKEFDRLNMKKIIKSSRGSIIIYLKKPWYGTCGMIQHNMVVSLLALTPFVFLTI